MITLQKQAADALIVKSIQHGTVKTQSFVDEKPGHIDNKDIKRLGYKNAHPEKQFFEIQEKKQ